MPVLLPVTYSNWNTFSEGLDMHVVSVQARQSMLSFGDFTVEKSMVKTVIGALKISTD